MPELYEQVNCVTGMPLYASAVRHATMPELFEQVNFCNWCATMPVLSGTPLCLSFLSKLIFVTGAPLCQCCQARHYA